MKMKKDKKKEKERSNKIMYHGRYHGEQSYPKQSQFYFEWLETSCTFLITCGGTSSSPRGPSQNDAVLLFPILIPLIQRQIERQIQREREKEKGREREKERRGEKREGERKRRSTSESSRIIATTVWFINLGNTSNTIIGWNWLASDINLSSDNY